MRDSDLNLYRAPLKSEAFPPFAISSNFTFLSFSFYLKVSILLTGVHFHPFENICVMQKQTKC